jgi:hypothetical protein
MDKDAAVLAHDLAILEEMASKMDAYLVSDTLDWTIPRANMPKLTIGGFLMRRQRLLVLEDQLTAEQQVRLHDALALYDKALEEKVVRFETRAHQELRARISEWMSYLRDMNNRITTEKYYFAGVVDTRVVIEMLIESLKQPPYRLDGDIEQKVVVLDRNLRGKLRDHAFIWEPIWQKAYPQEQHWWLYGCPVVTSTRVKAT